MFCVLRRDPVWLESLPLSSEIESPTLSLLSGDNRSSLTFPVVPLLASSPLIRNILADLLPPAHSHHVISLPDVAGDVLHAAKELLLKGEVSVTENIRRELQQFFKIMGIGAFLSFSQHERSLVPTTKENIEDATLEDVADSVSDDKVKFEVIVKLEKADNDVNNDSELMAAHLEKHDPNNGLSLFETDVLDTFEDRTVEYGVIPLGKAVQCDICLKVLSERSNLRRHVLAVHSKLKPNSCNVCGYESAYKYVLNRHIRTHHTKVKPFKCEQCCFKTGDKEYLKTHIINHIYTGGDYPFQCDLCDYKTGLNSNLRRHKKTHTGEKPFRCDSCDFLTGHKSSLFRHKLRNH